MNEPTETMKNFLAGLGIPSAQVMRDKTDHGLQELLRRRARWLKEQLMRAKATPGHPRELLIPEPFLPDTLVDHLANLGYQVETHSQDGVVIQMIVRWW